MMWSPGRTSDRPRKQIVQLILINELINSRSTISCFFLFFWAAVQQEGSGGGLRVSGRSAAGGRQRQAAAGGGRRAAGTRSFLCRRRAGEQAGTRLFFVLSFFLFLSELHSTQTAHSQVMPF